MPKANPLRKCQRCRFDKSKCSPETRQWPGSKCDRCHKYGYVCSANKTISEEKAGSHGDESPTNPAPASGLLSQLKVSELLQTIGDLRQLVAHNAIEVFCHPRKMLDKINDKLKTATETLKVQAEQLNVHEKYKDAEYIYTRILSPCETIRWQDMTIELAPKLVLLHERMGNQSAAEMIQEFILCVTSKWVDGDIFDSDTEKLCQLYINFYDRVKNIVLEFGEDESFSAEFARMAVFSRTATLGIDGLSRAIVASQRMLVPKMALHIAVELGAISLTAMLVEQDDRDINLGDEFENTALHLVARRGSCQLIQVFLSAHADLEIADGDGKTALLIAAGSTSERGSEIVKCLLDAGANVNVRDDYDRTPLHLAARSGTLETVNILLRRAVDVHARNIDNETPLLEATKNVPSRRVPIVQQLLEAGAYRKITDTVGSDALLRASQLGDADMINVFLKCTHLYLIEKTLALHVAVGGRPSSTRERCISVLLKAGVDLEVKLKGRTALGTAMWDGRLAAARQLLEQGAGVETEIEGERLLCYCVRRGDESATRLVLEKGANPWKENHKGESPLSIAVAGSQASMVEILLKGRGSDMFARNYSWSSQIEDPVIHCAIRNSSLAIVRMLLEDDWSYLLIKDRNGNTALHQAYPSGILTLLLELPSGHWGLRERFNDRNSDCNTPLHLAVILKRFKTAKRLLAAQYKHAAYVTLNTVTSAPVQEVGSLLSLMTFSAGDPCFEAFEELKRFCQTLIDLRLTSIKRRILVY